MKTNVGIIGGGASGMMAAVFAAGYGGTVTILEHTGRIGKKILATGNGKCNYTNLNLSKDDYYANHPSFVENAISLFDANAATAFFERCGMLTVQKRDGYCYPMTGQASTVLNVLRMQLSRLHVQVVTEQDIQSIRLNKDGTFKVLTGDKSFNFDKLILSCGGNAAPSTGSDGSGYLYAKWMGHTIHKPLPVLTYLICHDKSLKELAGVRTNAEIQLYVNGKRVQTEEGELQLNKDNLSGIPVFQLSHNAIQALEQKDKVRLSVNLLPGFDKEEIESLFTGVKNQYAMEPVSEALCTFMHKKICGAVLHRADVSFDLKMKDLDDSKINRMISLIMDFSFVAEGYPAFANAQATMGGVELSEIDENMMSQKIENLYFTGEIMDVDGRCGGYNLQWAWSSGYIAGCHSVNGVVKCYESISVR